MCAYFEDALQPNKLLLVPRDCLKTTIGTAYALWCVLRAYFIDGNPCYRVLVDSSTTRLSKYVIGSIKGYVKNSANLHRIFGNLYSKQGDNADGFSLSFRVDYNTSIKEPNFVASGIGSEKTGLHFDLILMDDIVTKDNVRTVAMREKTWEHYRMMQAILESDHSGQKTRQIVVGTRYGDDDLYGRIILQDKERIAEGKPAVFAPMVRSAITDEGDLFYPDKLTKEVLNQKRAVMQGLFWAQYMNDPNKAGAPLKPEQLKWHSLTTFPELRWIRLTADPAYKEEERTHGDYSAIVVAGWDRWNNMWICDVAMKRDLTPGKFIETVMFMARKWGVDSAIIENNHQEAMDILFRREMQEKNYSFPIRWEKPSRIRGKESRWLDIQSYAERYAIKIAEEIPSDVRLEIEDEWCRAPFSRYDDFLDALQLQTIFLPIDLSDGTPIVAGKTPEEMLAVGLSGGETPFFGTLASQFPHINALRMTPLAETSKADEERLRAAYERPEKPFWEEKTSIEMLEEVYDGDEKRIEGAA